MRGGCDRNRVHQDLRALRADRGGRDRGVLSVVFVAEKGGSPWLLAPAPASLVLFAWLLTRVRRLPWIVRRGGRSLAMAR